MKTLEDVQAWRGMKMVDADRADPRGGAGDRGVRLRRVVVVAVPAGDGERRQDV